MRHSLVPRLPFQVSVTFPVLQATESWKGSLGTRLFPYCKRRKAGREAWERGYSRTARDGKLEGKPGNEAIPVLQETESWKGSLGTRLFLYCKRRKAGREAWERGYSRTARDGKLEGKPGNEAIPVLQETESWKGSLGTRLFLYCKRRKAGREAWERGYSRTARDGKLEGKPGNEAIPVLQETESWKGSLGTRLFPYCK